MTTIKRYQGRVYKITNDIDNMVYVGSTTQPLSKRMAQHRTFTRRGKSQAKIHIHMRNIGTGHFKICLIEHLENCTKEELRAKEDYHITRLDVVKNGLNCRGEIWIDHCEHKKWKIACRICSSDSFCEHNRKRTACVKCGGGSICEHNRLRSNCTKCGGGLICEHGKRRNRCVPCGGSQLCKHNRVKTQCISCGGSSTCEHKKRFHTCKVCNPIVCKYCNKTYAGKSTYKTHCKTKRHKTNEAIYNASQN